MAKTHFVNSNLLDGEHPAKPDCVVTVHGNRIVSISNTPSTPDPEDRVVDCRGATLMPGMVSGHFHPTYLNVGNSLMPPLGMERAPALHAYVAAFHAGVAIQSGVTSVVGANSPFDIDPSLRDAIEQGLVVGPRVVPGSRDLITTADSNDTTPWFWESNVLAGVRLCDGPKEFRKAVRDEIRRGAEIVKLFPTGGHGIRLSGDTMSMTRTELAAAVEAAHGLGVRTRAHVASKPGIMRCLEAGVDVLDHGDGMDEECVQAIAEAGAILIPSLHGPYESLKVQKSKQFPGDGLDEKLARRERDIREMFDILPAAVEAGVCICLGDDYGADVLPHGLYGREPALYAEQASLPALEVIRWATVNGAALVGLSDLGRIEEGYLADLLVIDGDPSQDIAVLGKTEQIRAVMRDGHLLVNMLSNDS
jgi:imidazolonepropionase-like amidohydrolase